MKIAFMVTLTLTTLIGGYAKAQSPSKAELLQEAKQLLESKAADTERLNVLSQGVQAGLRFPAGPDRDAVGAAFKDAAATLKELVELRQKRIAQVTALLQEADESASAEEKETERKAKQSFLDDFPKPSTGWAEALLKREEVAALLKRKLSHSVDVLELADGTKIPVSSIILLTPYELRWMGDGIQTTNYEDWPLELQTAYGTNLERAAGYVKWRDEDKNLHPTVYARPQTIAAEKEVDANARLSSKTRIPDDIIPPNVEEVIEALAQKAWPNDKAKQEFVKTRERKSVAKIAVYFDSGVQGVPEDMVLAIIRNARRKNSNFTGAAFDVESQIKDYLRR